IANCSGVPGDWVSDHLGGALIRGRGLRPTLRGLATLGRFVAYRDRPREAVPPEPAPARPAWGAPPGGAGDRPPYADADTSTGGADAAVRRDHGPARRARHTRSAL